MASPNKKLSFAMIHQILPEEIMVMILQMLDFQSLTIAHKVCVRELIHGFDLFNLKNFGKLQLQIINICAFENQQYMADVHRL